MIKILNYNQIDKSEIFARVENKTNVEEIVSGIIADVRANGDKALLAYCEKFDKVKLDSFEVTEEEIEEAFNSVDEEFLDVLREAADNIREFHSHQKRNSFIITGKNGAITGLGSTLP